MKEKKGREKYKYCTKGFRDENCWGFSIGICSTKLKMGAAF